MFPFKALLNVCIPSSNILFPVCTFALTCGNYSEPHSCFQARLKSSSVSVVLTFSASLSGPILSRLIKLSVLYSQLTLRHLMICLCWLTFQVQWNQRCVDFQCLAQCTCSFQTDTILCLPWFLIPHPDLALFCRCMPLRSNVANVVLTFKASLSALAPSAPIILPIF